MAMKGWMYEVLCNFLFSPHRLLKLIFRAFTWTTLLSVRNMNDGRAWIHVSWGLKIKLDKINTNILQQWKFMWNSACRFPFNELKSLLPVLRNCPDNASVAMEASSILVILGSPINSFTWLFPWTLGEKITTKKKNKEHRNSGIIWSPQVSITCFQII